MVAFALASVADTVIGSWCRESKSPIQIGSIVVIGKACGDFSALIRFLAISSELIRFSFTVLPFGDNSSDWGRQPLRSSR